MSMTSAVSGLRGAWGRVRAAGMFTVRYDTYGPRKSRGSATQAFDDQPQYEPAGHVLLSFAPCGSPCTNGTDSYGPVIGYDTGAWPPN